MQQDNQMDFGTAEEFEEVYGFLHEVCARYHVAKKAGQFDEQAFSDWVVTQAGILYIKYVLQPGTATC